VYALQPHEPEVSEVNSTLGAPDDKLDSGQEPFQIGRKEDHQLKSDWNPVIRQIL